MRGAVSKSDLATYPAYWSRIRWRAFHASQQKWVTRRDSWDRPNLHTQPATALLSDGCPDLQPARASRKPAESRHLCKVASARKDAECTWQWQAKLLELNCNFGSQD